MKDLLKILAVIFIVLFVIRFCRANFSHMKADETYISTADSHIKIKLTEEEKQETDDYGNIISSRHKAYFYVNDDVYEGTYKMFVSNTFKKELWVTFDDQGLYHEDIPGSLLSENFYVKRNKLVVQDANGFYTNKSIFKENNTFKRKTWWNTWGLKLCIILIIAFIVWLLRIPEFIKNKKYREETIKDFQESKKEYDKEKEEMQKAYDDEISEYKELMKEGVNGFKEEMKNVKEGVNEIKDVLKKGVEEYKNNNKRD